MPITRVSFNADIRFFSPKEHDQRTNLAGHVFAHECECVYYARNHADFAKSNIPVVRSEQHSI